MGLSLPKSNLIFLKKCLDKWVHFNLSYFWILERQPLSVKVLTELYARENLTGYAAYERIDGKLIRPEAIQLLKIK